MGFDNDWLGLKRDAHPLVQIEPGSKACCSRAFPRAELTEKKRFMANCEEIEV